jgi:hypothetical protein
MYVHEDDIDTVQNLTRGEFYSLTSGDGWYRGDEHVDFTEVPDGLIRLVPERAK